MADEQVPDNGLKSLGMWCHVVRIYRRDEDHYIGYLRRVSTITTHDPEYLGAPVFGQLQRCDQVYTYILFQIAAPYR